MSDADGRAAASTDSADEELLGELRAAFAGAGKPTAQMRAAAEAAYSWRTVDADLASLAELTYDSAEDGALLVRSAATAPRALTFRRGDLAVELETTDEGIVGQLDPPGPGEVAVLLPDGSHTAVAADDLGCFSLPPVGRGPVRLRVTTPAAGLVTEWFQV